MKAYKPLILYVSLFFPIKYYLFLIQTLNLPIMLSCFVLSFYRSIVFVLSCFRAFVLSCLRAVVPSCCRAFVQSCFSEHLKGIKKCKACCWPFKILSSFVQPMCLRHCYWVLGLVKCWFHHHILIFPF
jgi:hypothetical protein